AAPVEPAPVFVPAVAFISVPAFSSAVFFPPAADVAPAADVLPCAVAFFFPAAVLPPAAFFAAVPRSPAAFFPADAFPPPGAPAPAAVPRAAVLAVVLAFVSVPAPVPVSAPGSWPGACSAAVFRAVPFLPDDPPVAALRAVLVAAFPAGAVSCAAARFRSAPPSAAGPASPDADCCTAVFFATMAAAPSHIVILRVNRARTINRLESRGNGAHRPIPPPRGPRAAGLHAFCPSPRRVCRPGGDPGTGIRAGGHSGHAGRDGHRKSGRPPSAARRTLGAARSVDGDE